MITGDLRPAIEIFTFSVISNFRYVGYVRIPPFSDLLPPVLKALPTTLALCLKKTKRRYELKLIPNHFPLHLHCARTKLRDDMNPKKIFFWKS